MNTTTCFALSCTLAGGFVFSAQAQMPGMEMPAPKPAPKPAPQPTSTEKPATEATMPGMERPSAPSTPFGLTPQATRRAPRLPNLSDRKNWPSPTADDAKRSYLLFDNFEIGRSRGQNALRFNILAWQGGDYNRTWFKAEGNQGLSRGSSGDPEVQLLRGKLISPFFDFQYGLRVVTQNGNGFDRSRFYAVVGLQGLSPYRFDIEPTLFLSQNGKISGRFTGTYDVLLSQKLILQPRFETSVALQKDAAFGVGSGINNAELSLRLRYEIRRNFAPYIGVTTGSRNFGSTRSLLRRAGEDTSQSSVVAGVRAWF